MQKLKWFRAACALPLAIGQAANALPTDRNEAPPVEVAPVTQGSWYKPPVSATWQWQLLVDDNHPLNTNYVADIYNLDLFNTPAATISALQAQDRKVICYFSAGSFENYRSDRHQFDRSELGNGLEGWPKERWLDIRSNNVRRIMTERLDLAAEKGCDAVEPDNVQGYLEPTGFDLSAEDQLAYNRFIANQARQRGLGVGLKNDLEQVEALVDYYDFSINEQCFQYNECDLLLPFIQAGKPVLHAEYPEEDGGLSLSDRSVEGLCSAANKLQFSTLVLPVALDDSFRVTCQNQ
ncbi:endo alpha-1,4 polygalactosaminidase [Halopseudomonas pelagia]|uniref:Endo alpha-1,4 polygalactosaminidase n=1 Tax=Halopseudomonas pelagia TaxID=553151 RepID=A0AA91Z4V1_9GAMM|nr:endo alpha-1,4 polygalactosaminidase [Halopseudomonas pelagia]PCC98312.1 endo alpha-1,4 polygalactosaminidase [Halopseudomonas pelagia]QFY56673.1 endo alpha-1,4 polygalactosaminidase [Halopseudomonas pelagia]